MLGYVSDFSSLGCSTHKVQVMIGGPKVRTNTCLKNSAKLTMILPVCFTAHFFAPG